ncbi:MULTISPECIES: hypothetical protein [Azotobacter]|uniref:hypothetical protein n=1 Tax=Azotobacter TaxID=352 RepID=UPI00103D9DDC|nr:hypothetical protein [Azotobacter chroococcum]TBW04264.1 hypothetical protein E0E52_13025 [Azotobacter chroococcum]
MAAAKRKTASKSKASTSPLAAKAFSGLGFRNRTFDRFVESRCPEIMALKEHERAYMIGALWGQSTGRFKHNSGDDDLTAHHWENKQAVFGSARRFNEANALLDWFVKRTKAVIGESAEGWAVTAKGRKVVADYLQRSRQMLLTGFEDADAGLINGDGTPYRMQRDGISSRNQSGTRNTKHHRNIIDAAVPVNGDALHAFNEAADAWLYGEPCPPGFEWAFDKWNGIRNGRGKNRGPEYAKDRVGKAKAQASALLDIAKCSNVPGFVIPTRYMESEAGRLYVDGLLNLQRCYGEVRHAAFMGCYDVDIANCHWSLLAQMAAREGLATPGISYYLNNKKAVRDELALAAGISVDDAKFLLTAMIYGATMSASIAENRAAINKRIGNEAVGLALAFDPIKTLMSDLKRVKRPVMDAYQAKAHKAGVLVNDFGNEIGMEADSKTILAHILQGAEACALRAMMATLKGDVLLLQHDGLTCRTRPNKTHLEAAILKETGYALSLEIDAL